MWGWSVSVEMPVNREYQPSLLKEESPKKEVRWAGMTSWFKGCFVSSGVYASKRRYP